jgi:hypothetical protein
MTQVAITGMPGYPGASGTCNTLTGTEYVHGVQNQSGTEVDVAIEISNIWADMPTSTFGTLMLAWFNTLPTTLPGSTGVLWNNGGTLAKS